MAEPKTYRFLVVVVPGPPKAAVFAQTVGQSNFQIRPAPVVKTIVATSAKDAADKAGVPAGATAHVCKLAHVSKFKRPETAALEAA